MEALGELRGFLRRSESHIDRDGELPAAHRKEIHLLIDRLSREEHSDAGYYRRAKLAIACAYSSLEILNLHENVFRLANDVLNKSTLALQGNFDTKELERLNGHLYTEVTNLTDRDEPDLKAAYAGFACFAAANVVLYDSDFQILGLNEKESDPSDWEASYYSSLAHSGGAVWEDVGDSEKRRQFWSWYLHTAIPYAWDTSNPIGPASNA